METLNEINTKLSIAENGGDIMGAKLYRDKIQSFEDEQLQKEWEK